MELIFGLILAALGLWIAFKLLVWALVALRIIFQLCVAPLIAGAITWWLWDNVWIGIGIGAAIVLFTTIKEGGIGWVFDNDSSSSSGSYTGCRTSSVSAPDIPKYDGNALPTGTIIFKLRSHTRATTSITSKRLKSG